MYLLNYYIIYIVVLLSAGVSCGGTEEDDTDSPQNLKFVEAIQGKLRQEWLEGPAHWRDLAKEAILSRERQGPIEGVAKNGIFLIGDGMGITSVTAARIFKGQKDDGLRFGEEAVLHMDTLPYAGASKTYCLDSQSPDSSCSGTAYLCGIKARFSTAGLTPGVVFGDCRGQNNTDFHVSSVVEWAQREGKSTGVITMARVSSIPGAASWASIHRRGAETDADIKEWGMNPEVCPDTGAQLLMNDAGKRLNVLMGGGRRGLMPVEEIDFETGAPGKRTDGRNLINEWVTMKAGQNGTARYITGKDELLQLNVSDVDHLLGLFAMDNMPWYEQLEGVNDPYLEEMVEVAVKILSKNPNGFFLFVHGSKIDSAHHGNKPGRALREVIEFDKAVKKCDEMTDDQDTLLVASADHSHTMGFSGYNIRGNPILRHSIIPADDGLVFSSLYYSNGPGPAWINPETGRRHNVFFDNVNDPEYQLPSPVPMPSESHGSEDVPIFAKGPYAHYFSGVHEQSNIPHLFAYAMCTGDGLKNRYCNPKSTEATTPSSAGGNEGLYSLVIIIFISLYNLQ